MRTETIIKSRGLTGVNDLTLFAPVRQGLVPSLEAVTYKTRVKMLLRTLSGSRASPRHADARRDLNRTGQRTVRRDRGAACRRPAACRWRDRSTRSSDS